MVSASCCVLFDFSVPCSGTGAHLCGERHFLGWCTGLMGLPLLEIGESLRNSDFVCMTPEVFIVEWRFIIVVCWLMTLRSLLGS